MTLQTAQIQFRGEVRDVIFEYEGDGVIVWGFPGEDVCFGKDATESEQDAVHQQLWEMLEAFWSEPLEGDVRIFGEQVQA